MKPKRIQRRRTRGWKMPKGAVYVGRPTKWGNPMRVGMYRDFTRADAVEHFKRWVNGQEALNATEWGNGYGAELKEAIRRELRGKSLACWCHLCERHKDGKPLGIECSACDPCHADIELEIANS